MWRLQIWEVELWTEQHTGSAARSSSFALCPLRSLGTITTFFQAIAKLNLPHKLIAQHFKRVCVCVLGDAGNGGK